MKKIITLLCLLLSLCACTKTPNEPIVEEVKINELYPEITGECMIKNASQDDILAMLKNGTGVVFFSWIDCPWCHGYIDILNEAAINNEINVLYYDIYDDRDANNKFYQEVQKLIEDYVDIYAYETYGEVKKAYDTSGKVRVYVPMTIIVDKGQIIGMDYSSSMESNFEENFDKYWNEEIKAGFTKRAHLSEYLNNSFATIKQSLIEQGQQGCEENCKIG